MSNPQRGTAPPPRGGTNRVEPISATAYTPPVRNSFQTPKGRSGEISSGPPNTSSAATLPTTNTRQPPGTSTTLPPSNSAARGPPSFSRQQMQPPISASRPVGSAPAPPSASAPKQTFQQMQAARSTGGGGLPPSISQGLDVRKAISSYFERIISLVTDMKVVLFDEESKWTVSMVYTQSQILEKSVFLTASLIPPPPKFGQEPTIREKMPHLKGVVLCRPTEMNIQEIIRELENPLYGEYHLFFTGALQPLYLSRLAEADKSSVVRQVQEFYCDYLAVNSDLFDFSLEGSLKITKSHARFTPHMDDILRRSAQGTLSVLLSLRQRPTIRFQAGSEVAQRFARELLHEMDRERSLFEFGNAAPPSNSSGETLLLILDRREDPVTPLITQWTYQAMVHELVGEGLKHNVVDLGDEWEMNNSDKKEMRQVVLSQMDEFYLKNMFKDYGTLAENTKRMLDDYKEKFTQGKRSLDSVEKMTTLVESLPEFKKLANNALKHSAVVGEITSAIGKLNLMKVSALEQEIVGPSSDHASHLEKVKQMIKDPEIYQEHKLRVALLYALRYETHGGNRIGDVKQLLRASKIREDQIKLVDALLNYAGTARRTNPGDLFGGNADFFSSVRSKIGVVSSNQVSNALMHHKPLLAKTLEEARTGRLSESRFPSLTGAPPNAGPQTFAPATKEIIVLMLGGTTFAEATAVAAANEASLASSPFKVLLGGTSILNSKMFLEELGALQF